MSAKAVREETGKRLLNDNLVGGVAALARFAVVTPATDWEALVEASPWLCTEVGERRAKGARKSGFCGVVQPGMSRGIAL